MERTAAVLLFGFLVAAATAGEPGELRLLPPCDGDAAAVPAPRPPQRATIVYVPPVQLPVKALPSATALPLNMPRPPLPPVPMALNQETVIPRPSLLKVTHQVEDVEYDAAGKPQTTSLLPPSPPDLTPNAESVPPQSGTEGNARAAVEPSGSNGNGCHGNGCNGNGCSGRHGPVARLHSACREEAGRADLFCEPPFGAGVRAALNAQIRSGLADQLVLYQYDFLPGDQAGQLSARGSYQLAKFADLMLTTGISPLVIEATPSAPQLDEARRMEALGRLRAIDPSFTDGSVVIDRPRANGLRGEEARLIDLNNLLNTERRGRLLPALNHGGLSGVETR